MSFDDRFLQKEAVKATTVHIPNSLWELAKRNLVEFRSTMKFGINFALAEKGVVEYPNNKLSLKMFELTEKLSDISQKYYELKEKYEPEEKKEEVKDVEDEFKEVGI